MVAIDYNRKPFYGDSNVKIVVGGPYDRGTSWSYCYASIHIVEAGRRLTLYMMPINQFIEKTCAVERLLEEAKARGVHVKLVLLARAAKRPFDKPLVKLGNLATHFDVFMLGGLGPPRP